MHKNLLSGYRIGGDVIDRVELEEASVPVLALHHTNSGESTLSPESAPAGSEHVPDAIETDPVPEPNALKFERDGMFHVFTLGDTVYRLGGVKPLFVTSLRVNIRAMCRESSYYDSLDLYAAKARTGFAQALCRTWGAEIARVEKDLVLILEKLEAERDDALRSGSARARVEVSVQDRELGLKLLRDPRLFDRIVSDMSALGYVGEDLNKELLYLCASSRKLDDPISVLILSQSASGKSFLVDTVKKLMPPEEVVAVTSLSDQALNYIDDLTHKFLILGEAVHGDVVEHQIREMLSGKELSRLVTIKDPETGKMQSRVVRTPVIVSSVMSGTNHAVNPENASRCFVVNADESREQTERIHAQQRGKYSLTRLQTGHDEAELIVRAHRAAQRLLVKRNIVNDFAHLLSFPTTLMRARRDHDRFLDLIACVCYVRQFQKKEETQGGVSFIRCDIEDYRIAYRIMVEGVMSSTVRELPGGTIALYEELRAYVKKEATKQRLKPEEVSFTQRQVREVTGLGHTWVKRCMRELVEYDHLALSKGGAERSRSFYRLREDAEIKQIDLSMIPNPKEMEERARQKK